MPIERYQCEAFRERGGRCTRAAVYRFSLTTHSLGVEQMSLCGIHAKSMERTGYTVTRVAMPDGSPLPPTPMGSMIEMLTLAKEILPPIGAPPRAEASIQAAIEGAEQGYRDLLLDGGERRILELEDAKLKAKLVDGEYIPFFHDGKGLNLTLAEWIREQGFLGKTGRWRITVEFAAEPEQPPPPPDEDPTGENQPV